jgi:hypothetical protein
LDKDTTLSINVSCFLFFPILVSTFWFESPGIGSEKFRVYIIILIKLVYVIHFDQN